MGDSSVATSGGSGKVDEEVVEEAKEGRLGKIKHVQCLKKQKGSQVTL